MSDILQEYLKQLHTTFNKKDDPSRHTQATAIVKDIVTFALDISHAESAYCSSLVFSNEYGVLKFLEVARFLKEFEGVRADIFRFLVQYCSGDVERTLSGYLKIVRDACVSSYMCDTSVRVKTEALNVLLQLMSSNNIDASKDLLISDLVSKFWSECLKSSRYGATLRCALYSLMGELAERYPAEVTANSDRLLSMFIGFLKQEMENPKKSELLVIAGCLKGLKGFLVNFTQSVAEGSKNAEPIYKYTKKVLTVEKINRYEAVRAALDLFRVHCAQFKELITRDADEVYSALERWSSHINKDVKDLAISTADVMLLQIASCISESGKDSKSFENVLKKFMSKFYVMLNSPKSTTKEIAKAVKGYGLFAGPCRNFLSDEDMRTIFEQVLQRSEQCYRNVSNVKEDGIYQLPVFLEALARIVKNMSEISPSSIASMENIVISLFDFYPQLSKKGQLSYQDILALFIEALSSSASILKTCLPHITYQCLIRTISHVPLDVEADDAGANLRKDPPTTYKTFLPIWCTLLDYKKYKVDKLDEDGPALSIKEQLYDSLVIAILSVMRKLNMNADKMPATHATEDQDAEVSSDPTADLCPEMPKDFQLFINLVDFCKALLTRESTSSFNRWTYMFTEQVITLSMRYPVVSGFYKLMQVTSYLVEENKYIGAGEMHSGSKKGRERKSFLILLHNYMKEVVGAVKQYKGDLLVSCLQFLLSLPVEIVKGSTKLLIPGFLAAFNIGLSYYELADLALTALLKWNCSLDREEMDVVLVHILPCLDDFLQSKSIADKEETTVETASLRSSEKKLKRIPVRYLKALIAASKQVIDSPLMKLKLKIVRFLGSLGGQSNTLILKNGGVADLTKAIAWDSKKHLPFALPFQDMKPIIHLDNYLPRVVELAISSSNRQTKVAACELLHALVLYMLGRSVQLASNKKGESMECLFRHVFPALIKLGCSSEQVAEQLFSPLVFQIIHWLSGNTKHESPETMALLDTILDGVTSVDDNSLRDFSAKCVKEFFTWSVKQTSEKQLEKYPANPKSLFKRMYSLALHPQSFKRLGAAIVFNNIYSVFREEETLVDVFTLEALIVFLSSLSLSHKDEKLLGTSEQCQITISHLEKIIKKKSSLLLRGNPKRNKPVQMNTIEAEEFNLVHVNVWILRQCGSPHTACRHQCMKLVMTLLPLQPQVHSTKEWMMKTIETQGAKYLTDRFEKGSSAKCGILKYPTLRERVRDVNFTIQVAVDWLENLLGALDCYCWVLQCKLVPTKELFVGNESYTVLKAVSYFVSKLIYLDARKLSEEYSGVGETVLPSENDLFNRAKCTVLVRVFDFLCETMKGDLWSLEEMGQCTRDVFSTTLFEVVGHCMLSPQHVGFNVFDADVLKNLPVTLSLFTSILLKHIPASIREIYISELTKLLSTDGYDLNGYMPMNFSSTSLREDNSLILIQIVSGYSLLWKSGLLKRIISPEIHMNIHLGLVRSIQENLKFLACGGTVLPLQKTLADEIIKLLLLFEPSMDEKVVEMLFDDRALRENDGFGKNESRGMVFYHLFADILTHHVMSQPSVIPQLLVHGSSSGKLLLGFLQGLSTSCVKEHNKNANNSHLLQACREILNNWTKLVSFGKSDEMKANLLCIAKSILQISPAAVNNEYLFSFVVGFLSDPNSSLLQSEAVIEVLPSIVCNCDQNNKEELRKHLSDLIADKFPISSSDLAQGSSKQLEYLSFLKKMLHAMEVSLKPLIFEVLVIVFIRETVELYENTIESSLSSFIRRFDTKDLEHVLDYCLKIFMDDAKYPNNIRQGMVERICLPIFQSVSKVDLKNFFEKNKGMLLGLLETNFDKIFDEVYEQQLVSKICSFKMFSRIFEMLGNFLPNGDALSKALPKAAAAILRERGGTTKLLDLRRKCNCAAYNCLVVVISCTQTDLKFYSGLLFSENPSKGTYIFENLLDLQKTYSFESELNLLFKQKQTLQLIRSGGVENVEEATPSKKQKRSGHFISSQYLMGTSLSQDVSQFDFNIPADAYTSNANNETTTENDIKKTPTATNSETDSGSEAKIDLDELNQHECMTTFLGVLDHMKSKKIYPLPADNIEATELPNWMGYLQKKLDDRDTNVNIRLFIAKLIINRPKIFEPFGSFFFGPLIDLILSDKVSGPSMNYMVVDIIVVMLSWSSTVIPSDSVSGRNMASSLLDYTFRYCHHTNRTILKNNLQIIKTMMVAWKDRLEVSYKIVHQFLKGRDEKTKDNATGIQLLGITLNAGFPPYRYQTGLTEREFFTDLVRNITFKYKEVFESASEVCGLALKHYADNNYDPEILLDMIVEYLNQFSKTSRDRFAVCLYDIQLNYPPIVDKFISPLMYCILSLHGHLQTQCMQCIASRVSDLSDEHQNIFIQLKGKVLDSMLKHRDEVAQVAVLKVMSGLLKSLTLPQLIFILPKVAFLRANPSTSLRELMYDFFMSVHKMYCNDQGTSDMDQKQVVSTTKETLLLGINDTNTNLSMKLLNFWRHDSRLPSTTVQRLISVLKELYLNKTEKEYLQYATNLIMELTSLSPDYTRPLFETGLDNEENFKNYHVNFSWQRQNVAMTPLFASTQRSSSQGSYAYTQSSSLRAGMLRETQKQMEFTQTNATDNWMTPSVQVAPESATLSSSGTPGKTYLLYKEDDNVTTSDSTDADKSAIKSKEILKLKNKYNRYRDSKTTSGYYYAGLEIKKKKTREEARERQKAARDRNVVMYRKYRLGELPDIQIKHSELIVSLQALAQLDSTIAEILFCNIISSIVQVLPELLSEDAVGNVQSNVEQGLSRMLTVSSLNSAPFICAVENVLYENKQFSIDPETVTRASILSLQQPLGVLLLEKQLLENVDLSSSSKRRRMHNTESMSMKPWMELAKMYESIKDYDSLRSIFSSEVSVVEKTRQALVCEARNDYQTALDLYRELCGEQEWDNSPAEEEQDYWELARLRCYENLTLWEKLSDYTVQLIELQDETDQVDLMNIWSSEMMQETYLSCYIKSNIKLYCQGKVDSVHGGFENFIAESLKQEVSKEQLESRFCDELALLNIFKDQHGVSQHYINISIQNFLDDWHHSSKLVTSGRRSQLERLQKIREMEEFIASASTGNCRIEVKVRELVDLWDKRLLSRKMHTVSAWDDIMSSRRAYIRKLKVNFETNSAFSTYLDVAEMKCIVHVADVARKQGNFGVANRLLRESSVVTTPEYSEVAQGVTALWRLTYVKLHRDRAKLFLGETSDNLKALITAYNQLEKCSPVALGVNESEDKDSLLLHDVMKFDIISSLTNTIDICSPDVFEMWKHKACNTIGIDDVPGSLKECTARMHTRGFDVLYGNLNKWEAGSEVKQNLLVKALMKLVVFCDERIKEGDEQDQRYAQLVVKNLLAAMKMNCQKARLRFPRLLQILESHPSTQEVFKEMSAEVPCWMYLGWTNQIVALLDKPLQRCVVDILNAVAHAYPQALMYSLQVSGAQYQFPGSADGEVREQYFKELSAKVTSPLLNPFTLALGQLTNPVCIFKDFLNELCKHVKNMDRKKIETSYKLFSRTILKSTGGGTDFSGTTVVNSGSILKTFQRKFAAIIESELGKDGKKVVGMSVKEFAAVRRKLIETVKTVKEGQKHLKGTLKEFSPWLSEFQAEHYGCYLEIPGQYNGQTRPMVEYHVKISGFDERLLTLESMREPKRLKIRGNDEKEYTFLVKGGEDLRLDQRIEQVFELMNHILQADPVCSHRLLRLKTYKVIPVTAHMGIIEWVDNTIPYKSMLEDSMTENELKASRGPNAPIRKFLAFTMKYKCAGDYNNLYKVASHSDVERSHNEIVASVPWDLLRRSFAQMGSSPEAYFVLRSHFVQSYSTMCIAQYLLGIGDRHRSNMLIDKLSGGVVGIDFGHAFGSATQILPVPELMPFRLTKQMLNLMLPIRDASPFKQTMIAVLQALRKHSSILLNTMDVFIKEPLLDWLAHAEQHEKNDEVSDEMPSSNWYSQEKIAVCQLKLSGINPAFITAEELRIGHQLKSIHTSFIEVAKGRVGSVRRRLLDESDEPGEHHLSVEEQVDCLVDQATDVGILGRTWGGWEAWV